MKHLSFVTVSRGRLHHIQQTLPRMIGQGADVIVVDYGCPDGTGDWVLANLPEAKVVRVADDPGFCLARARNRGAAAADGNWLVFVDADVKTKAGWAAWIHDQVEPGRFYLAAATEGRHDPNLRGTMICPREGFERVGGYDEAYRGWGGEDDDFCESLVRAGWREDSYPVDFVEPIPHGDDLRAGWSGFADQSEKILLNQCYRAAKFQLMTCLGQRRSLPFDLRMRLMERTRQLLANWLAAGAAEPITIRYSVAENAIQTPAPYGAAMKLEFAITVRK